MKKFVILFIPFISGCANIMGTAAYKYTHTQVDGTACSIEVGSLRDVQGASVSIDKNCKLIVNVESLTANETMAKAILGLVKKIPDVQIVPAP